MPYTRKRVYKRRLRKKSTKKKKYVYRGKSGQKSIKAKKLTKGSGSGSFQMTRSIPPSLKVKLTYSGSFTMNPDSHQATIQLPRQPMIWYFSASSLNPGLFHATGGTTIRNWPYAGANPSDPTSTQVVGQQRMEKFYESGLMLHSKITYRLRVSEGQQPSAFTPPGPTNPSYVNDFFVSIQNNPTALLNTSPLDKVRTSGRKIRMYNQTSGRQTGGVQFSIDYDPKKVHALQDARDNAQLDFDTTVKPNDQPEAAIPSYFCVCYLPAYNRNGGDVALAEPLPKFHMDYHLEYDVLYKDKIANYDRNDLPLIWRK